jgi:hypothetical protein
MINMAAIVVVTSVPFGYGNLSNLELALEATIRGVKTYVINEMPLEGRDFTGGKATTLLMEMKRYGAIFVDHPSELPTLVNATHDVIKMRKPSDLDSGHIKQASPEQVSTK